jgi:hypothetical protein
MDDEQGMTFVVIYHGRTIATAKMIGTTTDPPTAAVVARRIFEESRLTTGVHGDRVISAMEAGRRAALRQIIETAEEAES